jgi:hypothetical protein
VFVRWLWANELTEIGAMFVLRRENDGCKPTLDALRLT